MSQLLVYPKEIPSGLRFFGGSARKAATAHDTGSTRRTRIARE
jgi:hypothetical protein